VSRGKKANLSDVATVETTIVEIVTVCHQWWIHAT